MPSSVYYIDMKASFKENLVTKLGRLMESAGVAEIVHKRDLVALKLHFGEMGNTAFVRPPFLRKIVGTVKDLGAKPFLTDANTLYTGSRTDAVSHLETATFNGFAYSGVDAPIVIADGLKGKSETPVVVDLNHFKQVYIGSAIVDADALISVAHFKGHELAGFGGTLKNLGMGCASRKGKLAQHSKLGPNVKRKKCIGCGDCCGHCSQGAISVSEKKARIDPELCIGCGECIPVCPQEAIQIRWARSIPLFMEKMVEYTLGVLQGKEARSLFINFLTDISPACDCVPYNDAPMVRDIGILASRDPVAIDMASADLVNGEEALAGSVLKENRGAGDDKFRAVYPRVDWGFQFEYAEKLGLGSRDYDLIKIDALEPA
jgi:uncharacterized protein